MNTEKNLFYYQIYTYAKKSLFLFYILTLFYLDVGLTYTQISILSVLGTISTFLFEVPTGIISDKWSHKKSLQVATAFKVLSTAFLLVPKFEFLCISSILWGIADSCDSGSDQALLYEGIKDKNIYHDFLSKVYSRGYIASALATGLATVLFSVNIYLPIILSLILIVISLVAITLFKENSDIKKEDNSIVSFNKQALSYVFQNKILLNLLLLMTCCTVIIMNNNSYCQPLLLEKGMDIKILGTLMLAYNLLMSVGSKISKRLTNIYFPYGILFLFCICSIFIGSGNLYLAIVLFAVHRFLNGLIWPLLTAATNPLIPSDIRATVLSYQSMMTNVISMLVSPVVGIALDAVGLKLFYVSFGAIFAIIIAGLCMMRKKEGRPHLCD